MDYFDALEPQVRALVRDYGLNRGVHAARQFYGRWEQAREFLEAERQALQSRRWENI